MNAFAERNEGTVALVGLVRVSTSKQETARQHDALDPICERVFEEKTSAAHPDARPALSAAIDYMRPGTCSPCRKSTDFGRNLLGPARAQRPAPGIAVKVLDGTSPASTPNAASSSTSRSPWDHRRRDVGRGTGDGPAAACARGPHWRPTPRRRRRQAPHHPRPPHRRRIHPHPPAPPRCPSAPGPQHLADQRSSSA
jgi:hypothetical protein